MAKLEIRNLTKSFGAAAVLRNIDLTVEVGDLIAILGASGSGKTTLLRLIAGFEQVESGSIAIDGEIVSTPGRHRPAEQRGIGYVAQDGALFPHLSVAGNITFGLPRAARRAQSRVSELLELVGLPASYAGRAPQHLSGGEQQRVALARALAPNPRLILLDEPFSALDAGLRGETRDAVAAAIKASGATAILVTHDQPEALSMGSFVGVLQHGVLAQLSAPETLYRKPLSAGIADFVGDAVLAPGIAAAGQVRCALGLLPLAEDSLSGPVTVMIRPEQIKLSGTEGILAIVKDAVFYGHDAVLYLALPGSADITARVFSYDVPPPGSAVRLQVEGNVIAYPVSTDIAAVL